jgi:molybdenum cofactor guanylyltransferase
MNYNLPAYILCGGKSSRMKTEKGLVQFQGKTFVQWILEALYPLTITPVLITGNHAYGIFQLEIIPDKIGDKGPLGGIYSALCHASTDLVLILSCDIPKIKTGVLAYLIKKSSQYPDRITFLSDGKNDYPLIGVYPKKCLKAVEKSILSNELKLRLFVENEPHQRIVLDPSLIRFIQNINTKDQLLSLS